MESEEISETNIGEITFESEGDPYSSQNFIKKTPILLEKKVIKREIPTKSEPSSRIISAEIGICVQCKKSFLKHCNFDGICCFHSNSWNGFLYMCCKQTFVKAIGCKYGKHVTMEENPKKVIVKCSGCKALGHYSKECPMDPNTRTGANPLSELERISSLGKAKSTNRMSSTKKYHVGSQDFTDIACLKSLVKYKIDSFLQNTKISQSTEEEDISLVKRTHESLYKKIT